ncbi:GspE/PulE family protein [Robbsia andropogonis]|uniref:GspE/PulE family protein n=1 Tax=Robbsia andropogonis TaxID=28092 RepID=UPI00209D7209|nr:ATPase, T2SS/T4P/T4SS family [Robbsia andropogonis]MCP1121003.1 Flp pilus assembly complex ATPase component TadA [Robbsia andropogonis]MCP1130816.1 Flp pilus assembly complex ATPase component TadA [Robbsia andropogonis]
MPLDSDFFTGGPLTRQGLLAESASAAETARVLAQDSARIGVSVNLLGVAQPVAEVADSSSASIEDADAQKLERLLRKHGVKEAHIRASILRARLTGEALTTIMRSNDYGFLSPERIAQVNAEMSGFAYFSPDDANCIDANTIRARVPPFKLAGFVPVQFQAPNNLVVALTEVRDSNRARSEFNAFNVEWRIASPRTVQTLYQRHFARSDEAFDKAYEAVRTMREDDDKAAVRLGNLEMALIRHACYCGASDIALQAMVKDTGGIVRLKINGVGELFRYLERDIYRRLVNRLVVSNGNTDALKKGPIEAQIAFSPEQQREYAEIYHRYAFRVQMIRRSEMQSDEYTSIVIRILDQNAEATDIDRLGFDDEDLRLLRKAMRSAYGLILTTGPTGSGKTTTTYAMLSEIDPVENWIQSIERPIEYTKGLWMQYQVPMAKSEAEGTADLLKGLLRNAPNVIYVAEVRDGPIGMQLLRASNTGHLAFSSLHNNDAASALSRLRDLGLDMSDVGGVLLVIVAQRLVRTLCVTCRVPDDRAEVLTEVERAGSYLGAVLGGHPATLYRASAEGCAACKFTGYRSRAMVYEMLHMTPRVRRLIAQGTAPYLIAQEFIPADRTLRSRAVRLMARGITSYEEVERLEEREE